MAKSGVKGTALESVVVDIQQLLERGELSRDELEIRLTREDLTVVESKIQGALWYPLDTFGRLTEILLDKVGRGQTEYLVERGRKAAERIGRTGIYSQLSASREHYGDRIGRVMATLGPAMYRDTEWAHEVFDEDGGRGSRTIATVPAEFPDLCRYSTQGFIHYLTEVTMKVPYRVTSRRDSAILMTFEGRPE